MTDSETQQLVEVGAIVLASTGSTGVSGWVPAIVEKVGSGNQIVGTAFVNGHAMPIEGAKHVDDPWWQISNSKTIAVEEGVWMWRLSDHDKRLREMEQLAFEVLSGSAAAPPPKKPTEVKRQTVARKPVTLS